MKLLPAFALTATLLAASFAAAQAPSTQTFTFGKAKPAQQLATVESSTSLETFTGKTSTLSGKVTVNRAKKKVQGSIEVDARTIQTGIPLRDEHMRGEQWLDTNKQPLLKFTIKDVKKVSGDDFKVTGEFSMRGVSKSVTADVKAKYIPAGAATKKAGFQGDVLHVDAKFSIKLSDYGITISGPATGKVADEVTIQLSAFGTTK